MPKQTHLSGNERTKQKTQQQQQQQKKLYNLI